MLRKVLFVLAILAVWFLAPAVGIIHAQGTTQTPQDVLNAVSPIAVGLIFGLIGGTLVGAPVIALFIIKGMLNSPVVLQFLQHLADSLSPEWKQVLRASGTLLDDISGSAKTLQPYQVATGKDAPNAQQSSNVPGDNTGSAATAGTTAPPSLQAQLTQQ